MSETIQIQSAQPSETRPRRRLGKKRSGDAKRSTAVIRFIEEYCYVPEGKFIGRLVVLAPWQKELIKQIYDNEYGTRRAIISFGRKNGKTSLAAFLLLAHLCVDDVAVENSQLYSTAQSREQAGYLFALAAKIVRSSPELRNRIHIREHAKELFYSRKGTRYRALSAEASTAYGLSPSFVVHDELGQVRGPRSPLYEALETATGAQENPLSVIISTQAPTDADLLSILIDDAKADYDPRTVVSLWTAPVEDDPFDRAVIAKANPALGNFLNAREVSAMAEDARRMTAREAEYRNLVLNQRVESSNPFVTPAQWKACNAPVSNLKGMAVYGGLDLSEVRDLTALVLIGQVGDVWHAQPTFWLPGTGLADKARADRVPYDMWASKGLLQAAPGASVSYEFVASYLRGVFDDHRVMKIGFDRWHMIHLKPWLLKAGFSEQVLKRNLPTLARVPSRCRQPCAILST